MGAWITYSSAFFRNLSVTTDKERQAIAQLVASAQSYIEKVCGRKFELAEYDKVYRSSDGGIVVLENFPVQRISRVCTQTEPYFTLANDTAQVATYNTTPEALIMRDVTNGVVTEATVSYAGNATLGDLAGAVGEGWTATVLPGYEDYPTTDLVVNQFGNPPVSLYSWVDYGGSWESLFGFGDYGPLVKPGVDAAKLETGILTITPRTSVRVVYTAGFLDVPEDIKQVAANLVMSQYSGIEGRVESETLGAYSYSVMSQEQLPMADSKILARYKDRRV